MALGPWTTHEQHIMPLNPYCLKYLTDIICFKTLATVYSCRHVMQIGHSQHRHLSTIGITFQFLAHLSFFLTFQLTDAVVPKEKKQTKQTHTNALNIFLWKLAYHLSAPSSLANLFERCICLMWMKVSRKHRHVDRINRGEKHMFRKVCRCGLGLGIKEEKKKGRCCIKLPTIYQQETHDMLHSEFFTAVWDECQSVYIFSL